MTDSINAGTLVKGRYRLERKLGDAGMGSTWSGFEEPSGIRRVVRVLDAPGTEEAKERFLRSARAASTLRGDNVVNVLDHGEWNGAPFVVTEFLDGEDLATRLRRVGTLDPRQTYRIVTQVATALGRAHKANIVHGDLKPEQIFLARGPAREVVKVLDFGTAEPQSEIRVDRATRVGSFAGMPEYLSPEQALGKPIDLRSDLWSLAAIAYRCLTGHAPFESDSHAELLARIGSDRIPTLRDKNPELSEDLEPWCKRALARDRSERFQTAAALADAMREVVAKLVRESTRPAPRPGSISGEERSSRPPPAEARDARPEPALSGGSEPLPGTSDSSRPRSESPSQRDTVRPLEGPSQNEVKAMFAAATSSHPPAAEAGPGVASPFQSPKATIAFGLPPAEPSPTPARRSEPPRPRSEPPRPGPTPDAAQHIPKATIAFGLPSVEPGTAATSASEPDEPDKTEPEPSPKGPDRKATMLGLAPPGLAAPEPSPTAEPAKAEKAETEPAPPADAAQASASIDASDVDALLGESPRAESAVPSYLPPRDEALPDRRRKALKWTLGVLGLMLVVIAAAAIRAQLSKEPEAAAPPPVEPKKTKEVTPAPPPPPPEATPEPSPAEEEPPAAAASAAPAPDEAESASAEAAAPEPSVEVAPPPPKAKPKPKPVVAPKPKKAPAAAAPAPKAAAPAPAPKPKPKPAPAPVKRPAPKSDVPDYGI